MKYGVSPIVRGEGAGPESFDAMARKAEEIELDTLDRFAQEVRPAL